MNLSLKPSVPDAESCKPFPNGGFRRLIARDRSRKPYRSGGRAGRRETGVEGFSRDLRSRRGQGLNLPTGSCVEARTRGPRSRTALIRWSPCNTNFSRRKPCTTRPTPPCESTCTLPFATSRACFPSRTSCPRSHSSGTVVDAGRSSSCMARGVSASERSGTLTVNCSICTVPGAADTSGDRLGTFELRDLRPLTRLDPVPAAGYGGRPPGGRRAVRAQSSGHHTLHACPCATLRSVRSRSCPHCWTTSVVSGGSTSGRSVVAPIACRTCGSPRTTGGSLDSWSFKGRPTHPRSPWRR